MIKNIIPMMWFSGIILKNSENPYQQKIEIIILEYPYALTIDHIKLILMSFDKNFMYSINNITRKSRVDWKIIPIPIIIL